MGEQPLDLSVLDPTCTPERWSKIVDSVATRAWLTRRRQLTILAQMIRWARPALAIAATVALVCWMGSHRATTSDSAQLAPAEQLSDWAACDTRPATSEIFAVLGEVHGGD
jgi:hypothetical protein